jgi:3-deoxy-D-arabino-heptulosonate 7-phosphate (DAHP) synthase
MAPMMSTMLGGIEAEKMVQHKEEMMERIFPMADLSHKIPERQMEMQPGCIKRLMNNIPFEDRIGYSAKILGIMAEEGTQGMGEEQKQTFRTSLQAIIDSGF